MAVVHVAVPILKGRGVFHLNKGRHWSAVEHLLLEALTKSENSTAELARQSRLPQRLVIEALVRLMRAGWVQLRQKPGEIGFSASDSGKAVVGSAELPSVPRRARRWVSFAVDKITGGVYRARPLNIRDQAYLDKLGETEVVEVIPHPDTMPSFSLNDLEDALFEEDEKYVGYDLMDVNTNGLYALLSVDGNSIRGMPAGDPPRLRQLVIDAASRRSEPSPEKGAEAKTLVVVQSWERPAPKLRPISYRNSDLVLGGEQHRRMLERVFNEARRVVIVHSTFLDERRFVDLLPLMQTAVSRGARVYVLWGKDDTQTNKQSGKAVADRIRMLQPVRDLYPRLIVDPFTSRSHAKILVADCGEQSSYCAVVGSCNWFRSGFGSFEASLRVTEPAVVGDVVDVLSDMVSASGTLWSSPVMHELASLASDLRSFSPTQKPNGSAAVIIGSQHGEVLRRVRDEAQRRVLITSHRLGTYAGPGVLAPIAVAVQARSVTARVFFTTKTGVLDGDARDRLIIDFRDAGLSIEPIFEPRMHSKMLAWDDDFVLITSQNWLSADSGDDPSEVGIFIEAPRAADRLIADFEAMRASDAVDVPAS